MTIPHPPTDRSSQPAPPSVPVSAQARRRHALGIALLMLGTAWLTLRLTGQIGVLPMPICWFDGLMPFVQGFLPGCGDLSFAPIGYGMLSIGIRHAR